MRTFGNFFYAIIFGIILISMSGCSLSNSSTEKVADVDFTVVADAEIPQEVKEVLEEKKQEEFRVVFSADENMYIAIGYGERKTSGYSISVEELYKTADSIRVKTNLIGPSKGETISEETTYPTIVIKIENSDYPVVFD